MINSSNSPASIGIHPFHQVERLPFPKQKSRPLSTSSSAVLCGGRRAETAKTPGGIYYRSGNYPAKDRSFHSTFRLFFLKPQPFVGRCSAGSSGSSRLCPVGGIDKKEKDLLRFKRWGAWIF
jgi:hypothetical protein